MNITKERPLTRREKVWVVNEIAAACQQGDGLESNAVHLMQSTLERRIRSREVIVPK